MSIDFTRSEGGAVDRPLDIKVGETKVSMADWGVTGQSTLDDHAKAQRALNEAPLGCTMHIPAGYILTTGLHMRREMNLASDPNATILGIGSDPSKHIFNIQLEEAADSAESRAMLIDGVQIYIQANPPYDAASCLNIEAQDGNDRPVPGVMMRGGRVVGRPGQTGPALRFAGLNSQSHIIDGVHILEQVKFDQCADAIKLINCTISGHKVGVYIDLIKGAFRTAIIDNIITSRDGAVWIKAASQLTLARNHMEVADKFGPNESAHGAYITIFADRYPIRDIQLLDNGFGSSDTKVATHIYLGTSSGTFDPYGTSATAPFTVEDVLIDRNSFGQQTSGYDIRIADPRVKGTAIGHHNCLRGLRGGATWTHYPIINPNNLDPADLLSVEDNGLGTCNVKKTSAALNLENGWTSSADFRFWKGHDGILRFDGRLQAGTVTANTLIGTLPEGFRPKLAVGLVASTDGPSGYAGLRIESNGQIFVTSADAAASIYVAAISFPVIGGLAYDPSY